MEMKCETSEATCLKEYNASAVAVEKQHSTTHFKNIGILQLWTWNIFHYFWPEWVIHSNALLCAGGLFALKWMMKNIWNMKK